MIYERFFQLRQRPFSIAPNPSFLYQQGQYREALAALQFGMTQKGGFVLLTGEVGTGKTTLCKQLLTQVPDDTEVALVLHPQLDRLEVLQAVCDEFGIAVADDDGEVKRIHLIHRFLLEQFSLGRNAVLIIDEAQHLDLAVLELVRLLTNLETSEEKLLQIILIGQPELNERLARYDLRQLNQRITVRYHLKPLSLAETIRYVRHRMAKASLRPDQGRSVFSLVALWRLHKLTLGIPRLVNVVADRALMAAYAENKPVVGGWLLNRAAQEVLPARSVAGQKNASRKIVFASVTSSLAVVALLLVLVSALPSMNLGEQYAKSGTALWGWLRNHEDETVTAPAVAVSAQTSVEQRSPSYAQLASYWAVQVRDLCNAPRQCWQGYLPLSLLQQANIEAFVRVENGWSLLSQFVANSPSIDSPLVEAKLVWQPPFVFREAFKMGDQSPFVEWLRNRLNQRYGDAQGHQKSPIDLVVEEGWEVIQPKGQGASLAVSSSPALFDWLLEDQVKQFQAEMGLEVDGVAGSQTLLALWLEQQATPVVVNDDAGAELVIQPDQILAEQY